MLFFFSVFFSRLREETTGAGSRVGFGPMDGRLQSGIRGFRPLLMVLSAKVQSQIGAVSSAKSSNLWTFGHPHVLQALTGSSEDIG